jgi:hypothetical protein
VKSGKTAQIKVAGIDDAGNSTQIADENFRIKRLPPPVSICMGNGPDKSKIKLGTIKQFKKLKAELQGSPVDVPFSVTKFKITVIKNGQPVSAEMKSGTVSGKGKNILNGLRKGQKVYIEDVYAKGPIGSAKKIPGLIFTIN